MTKNGQVIHITPVEQALLSVLGAKSGQIFTREKLAEILGAGQSPRSIDVQITRLRKKLSRIQKIPVICKRFAARVICCFRNKRNEKLKYTFTILKLRIRLRRIKNLGVELCTLNYPKKLKKVCGICV